MPAILYTYAYCIVYKNNIGAPKIQNNFTYFSIMRKKY